MQALSEETRALLRSRFSALRDAASTPRWLLPATVIAALIALILMIAAVTPPAVLYKEF
jgi:CHASE3 domain sensor protein